MKLCGGETAWLRSTVFLLQLLQGALSAEVFRDCTRDLYDRVVRFEYMYYDGYWMYPYNKLRQHGPSYHYTEKEFCECDLIIGGTLITTKSAISVQILFLWYSCKI